MDKKDILVGRDGVKAYFPYFLGLRANPILSEIGYRSRRVRVNKYEPHQSTREKARRLRNLKGGE